MPMRAAATVHSIPVAWTTQTRCPHTHSSDRKKRRKRLEDSFEEEENRNGRCLYALISTVPGPSDGVHLSREWLYPDPSSRVPSVPQAGRKGEMWAMSPARFALA